MDILSIKNLTKSFGKTRVLDDITLCVPEGSIFGFIGENGAGKTTTMKIVLGLLQADSGEIYVCGEKVRFGMTATNRHVGYLPDVPEFYRYMRPREYLRLCGEIANLPRELIEKRSCELLELTGLSGANKRIGSFSRGMRQRLGVAQALINEPKLLICDEPTSALDPVGRKEILDILKQIRGRTTVIFSTHILSDVERICDRAALLHGGKIVLNGTLTDLKASHKTDALRIEFATAADKTRFCENAAPELQNGMECTETEITLHARDIAAAELAALQTLTQHGILPLRLELLAPGIENLFLEAVQ
ncbi:MAG: ABC transporter ATP-binding protein [Clostridiales bacterium]|nr:ABC transporter ATP-binding protein [Clostridiales bacterium]